MPRPAKQSPPSLQDHDFEVHRRRNDHGFSPHTAPLRAAYPVIPEHRLIVIDVVAGGMAPAWPPASFSYLHANPPAVDFIRDLHEQAIATFP
jgi:hypothetical protein